MRALEWLVVGLWLTLAALGLRHWLEQPTLIGAGVIMHNLLVAGLLAIRRTAAVTGSRLQVGLAWLTTILPWIGLNESGEGLRSVGLAVEAIGTLGLIITAIALGRSFGIAPANRGLVIRGPYAFVRHPMYTSSLLAVLGYCLVYPALQNWLTFGVLTITQMMRALWEEALFGQGAEYRAYTARVRFRFVPCVW